MSSADPAAPPVPMSTSEMAIPRRLVHKMSNPQRGGLLGVLSTSLILVIIAASEVRLGFGLVGDIAIGVATFAAMALGYGFLLSSAVKLAHAYFDEQRSYIYGCLFAGAALIGVLAGLGVVRLLAGAVLFTAGWWGATISAFVFPQPRGLGRYPYRLLAVSVLLSLVVVNSVFDPFAQHAVEEESAVVPHLLTAGHVTVTQFRYGSGADARRGGRYGADSATVTPRVDLTAVLPGHRGIRKLVHARYWGIDVAAAPINARVWMPAGTARVPVALILHGAGVDESAEDGFDYLAVHLASHGIASVSIDANFLSGPWIREIDGAVAARELLTLAHLAAIDALDRAGHSPLAGRVDRSRIILIGHSRGGEAVTAVAMNGGRILASPVPTLGVDSTVKIRAVVALSPTEGLLLPNGRDLALENVSYLLIRGSQDADVPPEAGGGQYSRITWSDDSTDFKSAVVLEGANHTQFNARGGRRDIAPPLGWLLRDEPVLDGRVQRELAVETVAAFLADVLDAKPGSYRHFQETVDELSSLSGVPIRRRISSATTEMLESFERDADPFRGDRLGVRITADGFSVWREWKRRRAGNTMVQLAWPAQANSAHFTLALTSNAAPLTIARGSHLVFAAVGQSGEQDIRVEVEAQDGRRTSVVVHVDADPEFSQSSQRYRSRLLEEQLVVGTFPSLHTYVVPLDSLADGARLKHVRFITPSGRAGALMLDDIGLRPPP